MNESNGFRAIFTRQIYYRLPRANGHNEIETKEALMNEAFISFHFVALRSVLFNEILLISAELLNEWITSAGLSIVDLQYEFI